jgi:deazaflavin-dependent oxidoreductase (nitroreductase family)
MRDDVRRALEKRESPDFGDRTIDITTIGRRSGEPRRIEICFYGFGDDTYLSGRPGPRTRDWLLNLTAEPRFTFHLKKGVVADLPAIATIITDPVERRRILSDIVEKFNARSSPARQLVLEEWVKDSPLAKVTFVEVE